MQEGWGSKTAKFLPVEISANVRAQTETGGALLDGKLSQFGEFEGQRKEYCWIRRAPLADLDDADMLPPTKPPFCHSDFWWWCCW